MSNQFEKLETMYSNSITLSSLARWVCELEIPACYCAEPRREQLYFPDVAGATPSIVFGRAFSALLDERGHERVCALILSNMYSLRVLEWKTARDRCRSLASIAYVLAHTGRQPEAERYARQLRLLSQNHSPDDPYRVLAATVFALRRPNPLAP